MSQGIGNVVYQTPGAGNTGGLPALVAANNWLTVVGTTVQFGGPDGAAAAATLLHNTEAPLGTFLIRYSGIGTTPTTLPIFQASISKASNTPYILFTNSGASEQGRINFGGNDTYVGFQAGLNIVGNTRNTGIGSNALQNLTTAILNTAVGVGALQSLTGPGTVGACAAFGDGALSNMTSGVGNSGFGYQALINIQTGGNNTGLGIQAGGASYLTSADNTFVGAAAGYNVARALTTSIQSIFIGSQVASGVGNLGSLNIMIGYASTNGAANMGTQMICLGSNQVVNNQNNTTMIGTGMSSNISNIVQLGRADQNVIIGVTAAPVDNGNKLQIAGQLNTAGAAPLTLGAGKMDFGKVVTAASVLNATKYLEISVDGVLVKVCIN